MCKCVHTVQYVFVCIHIQYRLYACMYTYPVNAVPKGGKNCRRTQVATGLFIQPFALTMGTRPLHDWTPYSQTTLDHEQCHQSRWLHQRSSHWLCPSLHFRYISITLNRDPLVRSVANSRLYDTICTHSDSIELIL